MKVKENYFKNIFIIFLLWIVGINHFSAQAKNITQTREYQPIVVQGYKLSNFYGIPVDSLFMYAYRSDSQSWELIPFQIDERTKGHNPLTAKDTLRFYFIPEEWEIQSHDGVLSTHDELVFMIRDLGDRAPAKLWIANAEAQKHPRLELIVENPDNPNDKAYGYLYRSSTISDEIPAPYGLEYFPEEDSISTTYYATGIGQHGLIEDIVIKKPWGSGVDIFDTQKLRFNGILDIVYPLDLKMTEKNLYIYEEIIVREKPVVRLIRRAKQTLQIGNFISHDTPFYVRSKFYPYNGVVEGGASIKQDALEDLYPGTVVILEDLRQSWDFNSNATGMKFHNQYNNSIPVNGTPDDVDQTIDIPITEWSLVSGDQGSFFTFIRFKETDWENAELYYYDNKNGGQYDSLYFGNYETGDEQSFGDNGILFRNYGKKDISLALSFTAYFIPETNLQQSDGEMLAYNIENPVRLSSEVTTGIEDEAVSHQPINLDLLQNYPNPFNGSTQIVFRLPKKEKIVLQIRDLNGRLILELANGLYRAGSHKIHWDGCDHQNRQVASGVYLVSLQSKRFTETKKIMFIK